MRGLRVLALLLALAGAGCLVAAAVQGSLHAGLLLVVPFVYGTGGLALLGMLLLMAGAFAFFASLAGPAVEGAPVERRSGGVVLLGPIPIAWGSDARVRRWMLVLGAAMLVLWIVALLLTRS